MQNAVQDRPKTRFAPRRLAHANIFVRDLDESLAFYSAVCGLSEVFKEPGIKAIFLSNGSSHHDMAIMGIDDQPRVGRDGHVTIPQGRGTAAGLNHLGWEMENEKQLVDAYRRAKETDVEVKRTTDHGMSHSIYLFDPEQNFLEFYADATADWKTFYASKENQLISGSWDPFAKEPSTEALYNADFAPEFVESAPVHPRQIARVTLIVRDFEAMLEFYRDVGGLAVSHLDREAGVAVLAGTTGEPSIALFAARDGEEAGLQHLGFELVNEVELERLREDVRRIHAVPVEATDGPGKKGVVLRSPDGMLLEFFLQAPGRAWSAADARSPRDLHLI